MPSAVWSGAGLTATDRPRRADICGSVEFDYTFVLNLIAPVVFLWLMEMTVRGGVHDRVCGMTVDGSRAVRKDFGGETSTSAPRGAWMRSQSTTSVT